MQIFLAMNEYGTVKSVQANSKRHAQQLFRKVHRLDVKLGDIALKWGKER